ncbi:MULTISPECIES: site-specific tyrosine recombinase [unclassified Thermoanaerobacterium]|jgi:integrase/recombinase XerD|uniref:site-specific tyrosine recombinase n=1 Tax=unclassified Thermoanaerobacterium TaxID=2622527 RepID=UPI000A15DA74|nr:MULTISPECIES: site-specific tyrosine recombinase [unclassified Thermoanaerobacterium]MDE4541718.1 tyrosine recombinase XerD [Thermoanaerobacterium sp. R66]ORX24127.1 site-specific tyrosine recombinase XerD [Thermoanaerobacterium sp. PSU-2]HHV73713.1 tyrosine recombinase XerD [Thermoanaerobacterium sp.]
MGSIVQAFIDFLKNDKKLSDNTIESYKRDITQFMGYLKENNIEYYDVNKITIISYLNFLKHKNMSQSTISRHLSSIKSFYQYLFMNKFIDKEPAYTLDAPKIEKKIPLTLSVEQVDKLLSHEFENSEKGLRDKAILEVLYATGLKVSELISLRVKDVNLNYGYIYCKSSKERFIPIGDSASNALQSYISVRRKIDQDEFLFLNLRGEPLTRQGCWKIIKEYTNIVNPGFDITPSILRKSFAKHMLENGADIRSVQEILGYKSFNQGDLISLISKSKIKEVYKRSHPRA